jgi:putative hydrolase of the HAD superfamily
VAILFDLDDTLLDHAGAFRAGAEALYASVRPPVPLDEFVAAWYGSLQRHFERYLAGELTYDEQRLVRVRDVIDASLSDDEAERVFATYLDAYENAWALFPDVEPLLRGLEGHRLGIVTNGQVLQQRKKLERTGLLERFACVVISEEAGVSKPNAAVFHKACALLGEDPGRSVYVGDRYDIDAVGARRAGLCGVWLDRHRTAGAQHERPFIHSFDELAALVSTLKL